MTKLDTPIDATPEAPEHAYLLDDLDRARKRAGGATYLEAKKEMAEECYPLLQEIVDHFGQRMQRTEQALDALIDETESFLQPDLARQILANLEMGGILADAVMKLQVGPLDEVTLKKLQQSATAFLTAAEMTAETVSGVMLEAGEPEDEEAEEAEADEDDEADEESEEE